MKKFDTLSALAVPIFENNIDTDQLCPKQFLKAIRRVGFGAALFANRRWAADGSPEPSFILNQPRFADAQIMIGGVNFGSGSSREHAVWAMVDSGFRCVIAPSFGEIFYQNSVNSGLLAIKLPEDTVRALADAAQANPENWEVNLVDQYVSAPGLEKIHFDIEPERKERLLKGSDEIDLTLAYGDDLMRFQERQREAEPWL